MTKTQPICIIGGPTASGKTGLALTISNRLLAQKINSVIINADSMQIYKEIPILSAQPTADEQKQTPHTLYGHIPSNTRYDVAQWVDAVTQEIQNAHHNNMFPILVGGTGMYFSTLINGIAAIPAISEHTREQGKKRLDELGSYELHAELTSIDPRITQTLNPNDTQRVLRAWEVLHETGKSLAEWQKSHHAAPAFNKSQFFGFFLHPERSQLYKQCDDRFLHMVNNGALNEVTALQQLNLNPQLPAMKALGVPEFLAYLEGTLTQEDAISKAQQNTRRYAKRQITWFKNQLSSVLETINDTSEETINHVMQTCAERLE